MLISFFIAALTCLGVGWLGAYFQRGGLAEWYPFLEKSSLTPPGAVFGIVWTILYLLMALSISRIVHQQKDLSSTVFMLFAAQLFLNFMWSVVFFYFREPWLGMLIIILLEIMVVMYIIITFSIDIISSACFMPYAVWLGFASYLNFYIAWNN